jgi:UDP-N-acetylmuramyl tripeptide synthase
MLVQSHLLYVGQACSTGRNVDVFVAVRQDALYYHRLMMFFFFASSHLLLMMMMIDKRRMMPLKASIDLCRHDETESTTRT